MSEKLQKEERQELLEKLGISLPKDEEFEELLEREGIGYLIRKDVQESFSPGEIERINKNIDGILAVLAASPTGLSGTERVISEVLQKEAQNLGTFVVQRIQCDMREKGYGWKGTTSIFMSAEDWSKATKQVELIARLTLMKLARSRGLVPKVTINFEKQKESAEGQSALTPAEAAAQIEGFARKLLGDDYIMVKKRLQKNFTSKEDLMDACSEVQRIVTLFIDESLANSFKDRVADIVYRIQGG